MSITSAKAEVMWPGQCVCHSVSVCAALLQKWSANFTETRCYDWTYQSEELTNFWWWSGSWYRLQITFSFHHHGGTGDFTRFITTSHSHRPIFTKFCEITDTDKLMSWWRKYSRLVFCKTRGNSGATASTSRHWKLQVSSLWRWFHIAGQFYMGPGVALPECGGGLGLGVGLAGCRFLCVCKYIALLIYLLSMSAAAPSTRLMRALNLCGSCSWLGEHKGSWMVGYLCPRCAVTRHLEQQYGLVAFQSVRKEALYVTTN